MNRKLRLLNLIVCILLLTTGLAACGRSKTSEGYREYKIYCLDRDENTHRTYDYETDSTDSYELVAELLEQMSLAPDNITLVEAVKGFGIESYELEEGHLMLDVSEDYRDMVPTKEVLVRAALVRTLCQIDGVDNVYMRVAGVDLTDALGIPVGSMNASLFVDNAGNEINSYERIKITLYFANEAGDKLVKTDRSLEYNTNISTEKLVVEQLLEGPINGDKRATINPQTEIINVTIKDGIGYVSLSDAFLTIPEGIAPELSIYSIVNSLSALPGVNKVQISIDGDTSYIINDSLNLDTMFERNLELVQ